MELDYTLKPNSFPVKFYTKIIAKIIPCLHTEYEFSVLITFEENAKLRLQTELL